LLDLNLLLDLKSITVTVYSLFYTTFFFAHWAHVTVWYFNQLSYVRHLFGFLIEVHVILVVIKVVACTMAASSYFFAFLRRIEHWVFYWARFAWGLETVVTVIYSCNLNETYLCKVCYCTQMKKLIFCKGSPRK
jgi:hypothetical protein